MSSLTLYTNPMSRGQIAHWMLEEVGQPYQTRWMTWGKEGHRSSEYLAINAMGKLPALVHDGKVVTEAAAICLYLADVFHEVGLGPRPEERADYYRWTLFAAGPVEHAVTSRALGWEVPTERRGMVGFGSYERTVASLEAHLGANEFVCGNRFTAADVYVGSAVMWGVGFGTLPKDPALLSYAERLASREAHRRVKALNDAKIAETQAKS